LEQTLWVFFLTPMQRPTRTTLSYLMTYRRMRTAYSQKEVGILLGHRTGARVAKWESGRQWPSLANGLLLGHLYRTPVEELFGDVLAPLKAEVERREDVLKRLNPKRQGKPEPSSRLMP
jgi:hypothetical protein